MKGNGKDAEKPREVVHVRAKRGQATDSHSLAERVSKFTALKFYIHKVFRKTDFTLNLCRSGSLTTSWSLKLQRN